MFEQHGRDFRFYFYRNNRRANSANRCTLSCTSAVTHLGLSRNLRGGSHTVQARIDCARRAAYSLIPAGLHGENGLPPPASRKLITTYILPRLLYGLEAVTLLKKDIKMLDVFYKGLLRNIQSLREGVASEAVFLLAGLIPIEGEIHIRILTLFGSISRLEYDAPLRRIAERQIALRQNGSSSWFLYAMEIATEYGIREAFLGALQAPWDRTKWKRFITTTITRKWFERLTEGARLKSTLEWLNTALCRPGRPHHLWPDHGCGSRARLAASYRAKMLTGSYILQATRARYNQHEVDPSCPLCDAPKEDIPHILTECPALSPVRDKTLPKIEILLPNMAAAVNLSRDERCAFILNSGNTYSCKACGGSRTHWNSRNCRCRISRSLVNTLCLDIHNAHTHALQLKVQVLAPKKRRK